jgi:hypothetical protein
MEQPGGWIIRERGGLKNEGGISGGMTGGREWRGKLGNLKTENKERKAGISFRTEARENSQSRRHSSLMDSEGTAYFYHG